MPRSNAPQALSVVSVTHEGDPALTASEIVRFDGADFGFSHEPTWNAMPKALRGVLEPSAVGKSLTRSHPRVRSSIVGLFEQGKRRPVDAHSLKEHPDAGLKEILGLRLSPDVTVIAKATCWHVRDGRPIIPILQPRLAGLSDRKKAIYVALGRMAFCRGEWAEAELELIDLSDTSKKGVVNPAITTEAELTHVSDDDVNGLISTYLEAMKLVEAIRKERGPIEKKRRKRDGDTPDLFGYGT